MFALFFKRLKRLLRPDRARLPADDPGNHPNDSTWRDDAIESEELGDPFNGEAIEIPVEDAIDLHTFDPSETRMVLDAYIEAALGAGFREVRIIHGKGVYTQKRIVVSYLSSHPDVIGFGDAPSESGGSGATIAHLRGHGDDR